MYTHAGHHGRTFLHPKWPSRGINLHALELMSLGQSRLPEITARKYSNQPTEIGTLFFRLTINGRMPPRGRVNRRNHFDSYTLDRDFHRVDVSLCSPRRSMRTWFRERYSPS
jgi:hypothetical protein